LDFIEEQGRLIAKKTETVDAVDQVFGRLGVGGIRMIFFKKLEGSSDHGGRYQYFDRYSGTGSGSWAAIQRSLEKMPAEGAVVACDVVWRRWLPLTEQSERTGRGPASHADWVFGNEH